MFYLLVRMLRYALYGLDLLTYTLVLYLLALLPQGWLARIYPPLFWGWCRAFVRALGVEVRLHQHHLKPLPARYILIANHPSALEDIGIPALFPVYSVAKIEVRDWWVVGRISRAAGTLYVHREQRDSRKAAYQDIIRELEAGKNIAVYPEGGCKGKRIFETFRYGPFDISLRTGIPIVPVFLHYEAQHDFEWRPGVALVAKIWEILRAPNKCANYHVFDAIDPARFQDKTRYMEYVHGLYRQWQSQYLE
jgi:1-acyl-sn-glycerol-3-phosphate acyltransferase